MVLTEAVLIAGLMPWDECLEVSATERRTDPMLKSACYWRCYRQPQFADLVRLVGYRSEGLPVMSSRRRAAVTYELVS